MAKRAHIDGTSSMKQPGNAAKDGVGMIRGMGKHGRPRAKALGRLVLMSLALTALSGSRAAELKVETGVVVKLGSDAALVVRDKLTAGTDIVITSRNDDTVAGQTNAQPGTPAAGDWAGIRVEKSAGPAGTTSISGMSVRYAGGSEGAGLTLRDISPQLEYLQVDDSHIGVRLTDGASPTISGASFRGNDVGVEASGQSAPVITGSQLVDNDSYAIRNGTPETLVRATGSWWGHASGPHDPIANPQGQGDTVTSGVDYAGFLASAPMINPIVRLAAPAAYFETAEVALELSCVNAVEYRVAEDGAFSGVAYQPMVRGRASARIQLSDTDGRKTIAAQFRDASGQTVTATLVGGALVDRQVPTVAIVNPAAGSLISENITIEATASDASGIDKVQFYQGDSLLATDTSAPYSIAWGASSLADGDYVLRAVATDQAGRVNQSSVAVSVSHGAPVPDTEGPVISGVAAGGTPLADGTVFSRDATLTFSASDRSAVSRVELLLDGSVIAQATGTGTYTVPFSIQGVANGEHVLALRAQDSLGNSSSQQYTITIAHAAPAAPVITQPISGATTRAAVQAVSGTALAGASVQVLLNGEPAGAAVTVDGSGRFSTSVELAAGVNTLQATATDAYGTSPSSSAVSVTLDTSVPSAPSGLSATAVSGKVRLAWVVSSDPNAVAHEIYRANTEFQTIGEAQKIASIGRTISTYDDVPERDGRYYYRVVAVNSAGTPSAPTAAASAVFDVTAPYAVHIRYTPQGSYDAGSSTFGQGPVGLEVEVSEALQGTPYLSIVPEGGLPIPVELIKRDDTHYTGTLVLGSGSGTGVANVLFSARDMLGNRGDTVREGATLLIDTVGPALAAIELTPMAPVDAQADRLVRADLTFDEAIDGVPAVQYRLSGTGRSPVALTLQKQSSTRWTTSFELPTDAGASAVELLSFEFAAADALGNSGSQIDAANRFQVYQGELPALDVPLGLRATALPAGQVRLEWQAVDGATLYQLYRQAPGEAERTALARSATTEYVDATPQDGRYRYTVASLRTHNGTEAASGESPIAEVDSSRNAPGAPQNLQLSLTSQGVLATWQPPIGAAPASYRLYRAATSPITSVSGLTPIKQDIRLAQAVDASPSQSEHAYVVTAVDAAGNESAISNSAYLNFSLLPVATLQVEQHATGLPRLSWTRGGNGAVGYDVYVGEGEARVRLTSSPTTALEWTDTGFTSGSRFYTVEAVDEHGERQARTLLLPSVGTQVVSGLPLKRNVMNRLGIQVSNLSATPLASAQVQVSVGSRQYVSERFSLAASATQVVSVVVGGHADLVNPTILRIAVENEPHEGELARVSTERQVTVVDSALVVGLETESFVRGATGKVRLSVENTSDVQVELLTARNNGRAASNELRLKLLDADGNLLSTTPYLQATGAGVITLANGETVARIAPGQRYVSDGFLMPVPASSPDQVKLRLEVDALRYNSGESDQVVIPGMGSERSLALSNTPYYGQVASVSPVVSFGNDELTILGSAVDRQTEEPVANAPLRIAINQEGFERLVDVTSDPQGQFRYVFKPTVTDSGAYQVGAIHPDMTDRPQQAQFTINRVTVTPASFKLSVPRNYAYRVDFRAATGLGAQADNVRSVNAPEYQQDGALTPGIKVEPGAPVNIGPKQNLALTASVSGDNSAPASGRIFLAVLADGASQPLAILPVDVTLTEATPALFATPNYVEAGLSQGQSVIESVVLENKGFVAMTGVNVALVNPDGSAAAAWVSLASTANLGTIGIGERRSVDLNIAPTAAVAEGIHEFRLRVAGDNLTAEDVNVFVSVTQSGQGSVLFKAADIYTATRDKQGNLIPGLAGAHLTLQNEAVASQTYETATDAFGEAFFQNLPAGSYRYRASAPNHQEAAGRFVIKPGLTVNQSVFLEYTLISVEWSVREVTIEDRYEITLNATFETDVPAPVVVIQPTSINLPKMAAGEVFQGELVVTNYGLVRADDVVAHVPVDDDYFKFEFLAQPPTTLEAKQRVRLPYRVIALRSYGGSAENEAGSASVSAVAAGTMNAASGGAAASRNGEASQGAGMTGTSTASAASASATAMATTSSTSGTSGCYTYSNQYRMTCKYTCANGTESTSCGSGANWFYVESSNCPVGGSPVGGSGGVGGGGGGWGGSGGPDYSGMPGIPICAKGSGDCYEPGSKQSGGGKEGGQ